MWVPRDLNIYTNISTKETPFKNIDKTLYKQIDGAAMGSPLGPTFVNFYMGSHEIIDTHLNNSKIISKDVDNSLLWIYEVLYILTYTL